MTLHEQARAEYARWLETDTRTEGAFVDGFLAGHEAATRTLTSDPDFDQEFARMRGKLDTVRALHRPERPTGNLVTDATPPYCGGCYEAGGYDGAPLWEDCPTLAILDGKPH